MPISINLWVPARGQSRDSCGHYKVVSNLEGLRRGLLGDVMRFVWTGLVFRGGSSLLSLLAGTTSAPSGPFICQPLHWARGHLGVVLCFLGPHDVRTRGVILEQVERSVWKLSMAWKNYNCVNQRQPSGGAGGSWMPTSVANLRLFSHSWASAGASGKKIDPPPPLRVWTDKRSILKASLLKGFVQRQLAVISCPVSPRKGAAAPVASRSLWRIHLGSSGTDQKGKTSFPLCLLSLEQVHVTPRLMGSSDAWGRCNSQNGQFLELWFDSQNGHFVFCLAFYKRL